MAFCKPFVKENETSSTFLIFSEVCKSETITYADMIKNLDLSSHGQKDLSKFVIAHLIITCWRNKSDPHKEQIQDKT